MKPCKNNVSTLSATVAEGSYVQDSNATSDARRNRSLRHASDVGNATNGTRRFKLSPTLFAIVFGILSMLLLPSTCRSQTVEELQQQISDLRTEKGNLQQENNVLDAQICDLISQMSTLDGMIDNGMETYFDALQELADLYADQYDEREHLEDSRQMNLDTLCTLEATLYSLDPESPTYESDVISLNLSMLEVEDNLSEIQERVKVLDAQYDALAAIVTQASQVVQGSQALKGAIQQRIDALQSGFDSNYQRIQQIDAEIECLQNQINELNNM